MSGSTEDRLRRFLLAVAGAVFAATPVELWFAEHTESVIQLVPFGLCALGLAAVAAAWRAPRRATLLALRGTAAVLVLGTLFGLYEHFTNNLAFAREIRPNATTGAVVVDALYGATPLLAPGILALAGMLAFAATYAHPALRRRAAAPGVTGATSRTGTPRRPPETAPPPARPRAGRR